MKKKGAWGKKNPKDHPELRVFDGRLMNVNLPIHLMERMATRSVEAELKKSKPEKKQPEKVPIPVPSVEELPEEEYNAMYGVAYTKMPPRWITYEPTPEDALPNKDLVNERLDWTKAPRPQSLVGQTSRTSLASETSAINKKRRKSKRIAAQVK